MFHPQINDIEEFVRHSNYIENERSEEAFEDAMAAWDYIYSLESVPGVEDVLDCHKILMHRLNPEIAGKLRNCTVVIGGQVKDNVGPTILRSQVLDCLTEMMPRVADGVDYPHICRRTHIHFENIHPFVDGNGRVGRILYNMHRLLLGLPLHIIKEDAKYDYYQWFNQFQYV